MNFGPRFKCPPPKDFKARPMSARAEEMAIEQTLSDMKFFTEYEVRPVHFAHKATKWSKQDDQIYLTMLVISVSRLQSVVSKRE